MNATSLQDALDLCVRSSSMGVYYPPIIEGIHGIGKSQIVAQVGSKYGFFKNNGRFIDLRLALISDVGELVGNPTADKETGMTIYLRPSWFPKEEPEIQAILDDPKMDDSKKHMAATDMIKELRTSGRLVGGVLFYDEINRAKDDIRNACFQAMLDRRMLVHPIPYGWVQMAAINPAGDDNYEVFELDAAFLSRFCKMKYELEDDEWLSYAKNRIWEPLRQFLNKSRQYIGNRPLDAKKREVDQVTPCPRSWFMVSEVIRVITNNFQNVDIPAIKKYSDTFAGMVGDEVIPALNTFLDKSTAIPLDGKTIAFHCTREDVQETIKSWTETNAKTELLHMSVITATLQNCYDFLAKEKIKKEDLRKCLKNIMVFCMMVPKDVASSFMHKFTVALSTDDKFANDRSAIRELLVPIDDELKIEFGQSMYENVFTRDSK